MAFLTLSEFMRPFLARLLIKPAFEELDDSHAMLVRTSGGSVSRVWMR